MKGKWNLADAAISLEEVIAAAEHVGPQVIVKDGVETAVVISVEEYRRLRKERPPLSEFLRNSPRGATDLDLQRDRNPASNEPLSFEE